MSFPHTGDENSNEESGDLLDDNLESEVAVPFEDDEEGKEEDNF